MIIVIKSNIKQYNKRRTQWKLPGTWPRKGVCSLTQSGVWNSMTSSSGLGFRALQTILKKFSVKNPSVFLLTCTFVAAWISLVSSVRFGICSVFTAQSSSAPRCVLVMLYASFGLWLWHFDSRLGFCTLEVDPALKLYILNSDSYTRVPLCLLPHTCCMTPLTAWKTTSISVAHIKTGGILLTKKISALAWRKEWSTEGLFHRWWLGWWLLKAITRLFLHFFLTFKSNGICDSSFLPEAFLMSWISFPSPFLSSHS